MTRLAHGSLRLGALALSLSLLAGGSCEELPQPAPTVALAEVIRGEMTVRRGSRDEPVSRPIRVEREAVVSTGDDGRGSVRLDNGASLLFDRSTAAQIQLAEARLQRGRVWVDATNAEETTIRTAQGSVTSSDAAFAVALEESRTVVYCGSGEVTYRASGGDGRLQQGERLILPASGAPQVEPEELWDDWTGGLADPSPRRFGAPTAVGVLSGRGQGELGRARVPLPVRGHDVRVAIQGDLATTEVVQTFFNARSDQLEAEYDIRLPAGAIVSGFAVDMGSGFHESAIQPWATTNGYDLSWAAPGTRSTMLSYDGPGQLRARLYPVVPGSTVRVRIRWTEWLERRGDMRTYVYPMGTEGDPPLLGEFTLEVDTARAEAGALRAGMGAQVESRRVVLRRSDFRPRSDFTLDLLDAAGSEQGARGDRALAYVVDAPAAPAQRPPAEGRERYVLFDIPTPAPEQGHAQPPLELALVVDTSGATDPEDLELARAIVESVLRQLAPTDRVALLLADVGAHPPSGVEAALREVSELEREAVLESLARAELGGATDLGRALRDAAALVSDRPRGAVLYLGDGFPTTGALDATALRESLAGLAAAPRFFALGVGDGSNMDLLRRLFGDCATAVRERAEATRAVMRVLAEAARPTLRDVAVDLGSGVERVYPRSPMIVSAGSNLRLVGRLQDELPARVRLTARLDGRDVEQTYTLTRGSVDDGGDVRRRWAVARLAELIDADAGREEIVELGVRFDVITPWTSLVVDGVKGQPCTPVRGFDHDPLSFAWSMGGGGTAVPAELLAESTTGWRRNARRLGGEVVTTPESTWVSRVGPPPSGAGGGGYGRADADAEEGLARAAAERALTLSERGPRGCYERRLLVRPDLAGDVAVTVEIDRSGAVRSTEIGSSTLRDADVERCVEMEVRGVRFPATSITRSITVTHNYRFAVPTREIGVRRTCSDASRQPLSVRRALWRERLAANRGVRGALTVWREAGSQCELSSWRARRTLLDMMLGHVGGVQGMVALYHAFGPGSSVASYLARAIIRRARTPQEVDIVRAGLGFDVPVDWSYFTRLWYRSPSPEARLRLVRRWLEALPHEMDLRLRLLALLEETGAMTEARRVARDLRADAFADARVRTAVGEFWLRQENEPEARRVFSEIVEHAPLDPWARQRLGDLYRAHQWYDDAYREYLTLARLRPDDPSVMLLLARAAAGAGRTDEALRLEQELSESVPPSVYQGAAAFARLWTSVRLTRMKAGAEGAELRAIQRRERASGALRDPPALFVALTWEHPDDSPALFVRYPTMDDDEWQRADLLGDPFGIEALRIRERDEGDHLLEIRRSERDAIRDTVAQLLVVVSPGTPEERALTRDVRLTRENRVLRLRLTEANTLEEVEARR